MLAVSPVANAEEKVDIARVKSESINLPESFFGESDLYSICLVEVKGAFYIALDPANDWGSVGEVIIRIGDKNITIMLSVDIQNKQNNTLLKNKHGIKYFPIPPTSGKVAFFSDGKTTLKLNKTSIDSLNLLNSDHLEKVSKLKKRPKDSNTDIFE